MGSDPGCNFLSGSNCNHTHAGYPWFGKFSQDEYPSNSGIKKAVYLISTVSIINPKFIVCMVGCEHAGNLVYYFECFACGRQKIIIWMKLESFMLFFFLFFFRSFLDHSVIKSDLSLKRKNQVSFFLVRSSIQSYIYNV